MFFLQEMSPGNSKTALNSTNRSTVFPQKVRKFPAKIRKSENFLTAAVHACDKSQEKSQLVGMVISAYACFNLTSFKYSLVILVFMHVSGFESLAPISNTNSAN